MPALLRRERLTVGRHHGAPHAHVALPVAIRPALLKVRIGQVGGRHELRAHRSVALALRAVAGRAVDDEELSALLNRGRRGGDGVAAQRGRLTLFLGQTQLATARHAARRHAERALSGHDPSRLGHVVEPAIPDVQAEHAGDAAQHQQHEHEDVLHQRRTSSAPAEESIAPTASAFSTGHATATPKRSTVKRGS